MVVCNFSLLYSVGEMGHANKHFYDSLESHRLKYVY